MSTWVIYQNKANSNLILSRRSLWQRRIKSKKQPGRFSKANSIRRCNPVLCLHRNRLSKIIDIAANLEEKTQSHGWRYIEKIFEKATILQYITLHQPDYKGKYNVDKIAYGRDNGCFYFLLTGLLMFLGAPVFGIKVPKRGPLSF